MAGSTALKLGFVVLFIGLAVHAVGYATNRWATLELLGGLGDYHTGLWQQCFNVLTVGDCTGRDHSEAGKKKWKIYFQIIIL